MTDIWVCSTCHSINRQRDARCYRCGASRELATGALADTRADRAIEARRTIPYRGSMLRGVVAAAFIVAVAVLGVIVLNESLGAVRYLRDQIPIILQTGAIDEAELLRRSSGAIIPSLARTVCAIGALLFFAAWLSRVVANIPALGGGIPRATPTKAFVYPLIPVWNLFKTPPMIQEALYRLDPKAGGFFMILLAWLGLVGSWIVSFVAGWWVELRVLSIGANAQTLGEAVDGVRQAYDIQVVVDIVTTLMVSAGALVLVVVMFRIESRARARDREIRTTFAGALSTPPVAQATTAADAAPVVSAPGAIASATIADPPAAVQVPTTPPTPAAPTTSSTPAEPDLPVPAPPPAPASPGATTTPGAPPFASGPRLRLVVTGAGRIEASVDGSDPEATTLDEVRQAARALAAAGGSASVIPGSSDPGVAETAAAVAALLRAASVPITSG